nr:MULTISPECIES: ferredoxin [unclassified Enterococcus]
MNCQIIPEKCIACGLCQVIAPAIFDYTDEGLVLFTTNQTAKTMNFPLENQAKLKHAAKKCPVRAIVINQHHPSKGWFALGL